MANMIDIFRGDAFSVTSMTKAINLLPHSPTRIEQMGLFSEEPVDTTTVILEEMNGHVAILPTQVRGGPATINRQAKRSARSLVIPHIPLDDFISADSIQNVRSFGSETEVETMSKKVNGILQRMLAHHKLTLEYHRIGAIKGVILDADGSTTILNLFTEFGVTQNTLDFVLGTDTTVILLKVLSVKRTIEDALGFLTYDHIHAFAGKDFFDALVTHKLVKEAYARFLDGAVLRADSRGSFELGGVIFEEYRGTIDSIDFVPDKDCRFFPVGVPDLFVTNFGPGTWLDTVNTMGQPVFAQQYIPEGNKGVKLETESNPLSICTIPEVLVRGYTS